MGDKNKLAISSDFGGNVWRESALDPKEKTT
jgi:hypothetical protein